MKRLLIITFYLLLFSSNTYFAQTFELERLNEHINSKYDEISPVISRDGNTIYFTRVSYPEFNRTLILDGENWTNKLNENELDAKIFNVYVELGDSYISSLSQSKFNQDIWLATGSNFENVFHPPFPLNNAFPNSIVSLTPDPDLFYIVNRFPTNGGVERGFSIIKKNNDNSWEYPESIEIDDFYTITSDVSLTMGADGRVLILSAERFDSKGMDLYVCFKIGENHWSSPKNIGVGINTPFRETTPHLSEDGQTLYFSSDRNGNSDIFLSKRLDDTWQNWTTPTALAHPINSWADESQPYFNMSTGYLYFTSKRKGSSDIYRIQIAPPQPSIIKFSGRILNEITGELIPDVFISISSEIKKYEVIREGFYQFDFHKSANFFVEFQKSGFEKKTVIFNNANQFLNNYQNTVVKDIQLKPLEVNTLIELAPIFFVQSKSIILEKSYPALQTLANYLKENPSIIIRIEGHSDNLGKESDLIKLSENRANAIKNYLLENGIPSNRIETIGYGSKFPLNDNSTDELRKENRRVEIRIIKN